jgi:hypothetical protein
MISAAACYRHSTAYKINGVRRLSPSSKKACFTTLGGKDEAQTHLGGLTKLQNRRHQAGSILRPVCGDNDFSHGKVMS